MAFEGARNSVYFTRSLLIFLGLCLVATSNCTNGQVSLRDTTLESNSSGISAYTKYSQEVWRMVLLSQLVTNLDGIRHCVKLVFPLFVLVFVLSGFPRCLKSSAGVTLDNFIAKLIEDP